MGPWTAPVENHCYEQFLSPPYLTVLCTYLQSMSKNSQSRPRSSSTGHVQLRRILIGQISNLLRTSKDHQENAPSRGTVAERLLTLSFNTEALQLEALKRRRWRRKGVLRRFQVVSNLLDVLVSHSFVEFFMDFFFFFLNCSLFLLFLLSKRATMSSPLRVCIINKRSAADQLYALCMEAGIFSSEETSLHIYVNAEHVQIERRPTTASFTVNIIKCDFPSVWGKKYSTPAENQTKIRSEWANSFRRRCLTSGMHRSTLLHFQSNPDTWICRSADNNTYPIPELCWLQYYYRYCFHVRL